MGKMTPRVNRLLYSPTEVATLIGFGRTTVYELIKSREIPSIQIAGRTRVRREDLMVWIESGSRSGRKG